MTNWITKYKPNNSNDIIGNSKSIYFLKNLLSSQNYDNPNLFITGPDGIGKKIITNILLKELNIKQINIDLNENNDIVNIDGTFFCINKKKKTETQKFLNNKAIVIDDINNLTPNGKKKLQNLQKENKKNKIVLIIIISNNQHKKVINDIKKNCIVINFVHPTQDDIYQLINKICKNENMKIEKYVHSKLIEYSQNDIRRLINILENLKFLIQNDTITNTFFDNYCNTIQKKAIDMGLHNTTFYLLNNYKNIKDTLMHYNTERKLLPVTIHENYLKYVSKMKITNKEQHNINTNISHCLSQGDKIESLIFSNQAWGFFGDMLGIYTCLMSSYFLNKQNVKSNMKKTDINFAYDINRASTEGKNKKIIYEISHLFNNKNINDYIHIVKILSCLIQKEQYEEVYKLMNEYKIDIKTLEKILKIDKINNTTFKLTTEQKREINKFF